MDLFKKYLLSIYYVPKHKISALYEPTFQRSKTYDYQIVNAKEIGEKQGGNSLGL